MSNGDEEATFGTQGEVSRSFWDAVRKCDSSKVSHFPGHFHSSPDALLVTKGFEYNMRGQLVCWGFSVPHHYI